MIFSAVSFLYLLPLMGVPVLFHFLLKQKKRKLVFSTLMFFHRTNPRLHSRRKIRQWLILLMRMLLIAFLLLALSRPVMRAVAGAGGTVSVVIVVDNSGSMSGLFDEDRTKLQYAHEAARKMIDSLNDDIKAMVLPLIDDPTVETIDSLTGDKELLLRILEQIGLTTATGNAHQIMERAISLLRNDTTDGGVVHIFSDLQNTEWGKRVEWHGSDTAGINVCLHKINSLPRHEANVALTAVRMPRERILPRHPYTIGLVLQNTTNSQADIRVNCNGGQAGFSGNQGRTGMKKVMLGRGMSKTVSLEVEPDQPGYHGVQVWIEGDGFSADNHAGIGFFCEERAVVLFLGHKKEFGVLPLALSPTGRGDYTGMVTEFCTADQLTKTADEKKPILIVMTWNGAERFSAGEDSGWLREYVEKGGNLLIVPAYGRQKQPGRLADWLGAGLTRRVIDTRGKRLNVLDKSTDFWRGIRSKTGGVLLEPVSLYAFYPLELTGRFTPLLGVDFKTVVLAQKKIGVGNLYVSGTVFDSHWNTLPATPVCVLLAQRMAVGTGTGADASTEAGSQSRVITMVAGGRGPDIFHTRQSQYSDEVEVFSLTGDPLHWKGTPANIPSFPRAGVYLLNTTQGQWCVSVRDSAGEALEEYVEGAKAPVLDGIDHVISTCSASDNYEQKYSARTATLDLFFPLLLLATLALLMEGWLANPAQKHYGSGEDSPPQEETAVAFTDGTDREKTISGKVGA